jgi:ABC-type dipeptide/oligopeptide/nickel transport systems, permease components
MSVIRDMFRFSPSFRWGALFLALILTLVVLSFFSPYDQFARREVPNNRPPSSQYLFGTTALGQDVFWQVTFAIRNTLIIAGIAVLVSRAIAVLVGTFAGYVGGITDRVISSITDTFIVIPVLPLLILIATILQGSLGMVQLGLLLGLLDWAWPSKRYRSQILALREEEFTQTAIFSGMSRLKIILREHFPFLIPFTLADMVSGFLYAIGMEITLAILGLSNVSLPTIGTMIYWANYYQALLARRWWWLLAPIAITILVVVAFYLISSALGVYLDPRTRLKNLAAKGAGA